MATRVFWHLGLPKSGTTYLQDLLWGERESLDAVGLRVVGRRRREHLWAALEVAGRPLQGRDPRAAGTWRRLLAEVAAAPADAVLSHEFFCGAPTERAGAAVAALAEVADEVHLVITARHTAATLAAGWQERVKNGGVETLASVAARDDDSELGWRTWDLHGVLGRWAGLVPHEHVHVLPVAAPPRPVEAPDLWHRWRQVSGLADVVPAPAAPANPSLGLVETELLRRVNAHLGPLKRRAVDRGDWIRGVLAEQHLRGLGPSTGASLLAALPDDVLADARGRARAAVDLVVERGLHVVGDLDDLLVPDVVPGREGASDAAGHPVDPVDPVDQADLVDVAARLVASLLLGLRDAGAAPGGAAPEQ